MTAELSPPPKPRLTVTRTTGELHRMTRRAIGAPGIAVDTETKGAPETPTLANKPERGAVMIGASVYVPAWGGDEAEEFYVPVRHEVGENADQPAAAIGYLKEVVEQARFRVFWNLQFDVKVLAKELIRVPAPTMCAKLMFRVWDPEGDDELKAAAVRLLGETLSEEEALRQPVLYKIHEHIRPPLARKDAIKEWKAFLKWIDPALVGAYAGADVRMTWRIFEKLAPEIASRDLGRVLAVEVACAPVLAQMEMCGFPVDADVAEKLAAEYGAVADAKLAEVRAALKVPDFNPGSGPQVISAMKSLRGVAVPNAQESTLEETGDPVAAAIVEYRGNVKMRSTYCACIVEARSVGKLHTSISQTGARTGRMSSADPNLQNVPIRTEEGKRIRKAFVASPGYHLAFVDYSQIELRFLAHFAKEPEMIAAFEAGEDIHAATARALGIDRYVGKQINFGLVYGQGKKSLARKLRPLYEKSLGHPISEEDALERATKHYDAYFARFAGIAGLKRAIERAVRERGYVKDFFGRRHYVSTEHVYVGLNYLISGSAAAAFKAGLVAAAPVIESFGGRALIPIHDAVIFEAPEDRMREALLAVREPLEAAAHGLRVKLVVDPGASPGSWYEERKLSWEDVADPGRFAAKLAAEEAA